PAQFGPDTIAAAWLQCREETPIRVSPTKPWRFVGKFLFRNFIGTSPGEHAAWRIASAHNFAHPVGNATSWHTSGAALTIWITRHWSAEQIGATLVRDGLCK